MKKFILAMIFVFPLSYSTINAQSLGIRGGLNFANASTDANIALDGVTGWQLGMTFEIPIILGLNIDASLMYARKGYRRAGDNTTSTTRVDYLDIPIDFVYKLPLGTSSANVFLSAGPYLSYGIYSSYDDGNGIIIKAFNTEYANLRKIDSGINLGGGMQLTNFRLGVYYGFGLVDINKLDSETLNNRNLKITGTYFF